MAELADAQDLGFRVPRDSSLLTDTQEYSRFISGRKGRLRGRALSCSFLLILWLQISQSLYAQTFTIPFESHAGLILLRVELNGKPANFLLDTGAQVSYLDRNIAGIGKHQEGNNVNGVIDAAKLVRASSLCIGPRCLADRTFAVVDYERVSRALNVRIDGQLGQDILREFDSVRIDYRNSTVTLEKR